MNRLKQKYFKEVVPAMKKEFGYHNDAQAPRVRGVILNSGVGRVAKDEKAIEVVEKGITKIAGQKAVRTKAKKSIATFKTREGMPIGVKVSLRGARMYDFLDRLISIAFPRTRDFRGIDPKSIDQSGNLTIGIKEDIVFPEASHDKAGQIFGFEVTVVTDARGRRKEAERMFRLLGFPLK
ncbi:50S ribosomal protein L5 [Candidatus Azambacteria bacterium]|nr:50S ribosomal protein L5 [Candidatus Azambacteria bacterium]